VVAVITVTAVGIGFIIVIAIVVGIVDAAQASRWRRIAAERRASWEARQLQLHGPEPYDPWEDD
jgi:hypothetical protein